MQTARQPDLIPRLVFGGIPVAITSLSFMSADGPEDLEVGGFPDLLRLLEPIGDCRDLCLVRIPWTQTEDLLEGGRVQ